MTNTFVTWLLGAAVAGLAIVLLLGIPATDPTAAAPALASNGAAPTPAATSYWHDTTVGASSTTVASTAVMSAPRAVPAMASAIAPCASCSTQLTTTVSLIAPAPAPAVPTVALAGGCGSPQAPCAEAPCGPLMACGRPSCPVCRTSNASHSVASHAVASHAVASHTPCGHPACGHATCGNAACGVATCEHACAAPVCDDRPRINRNGPACVDECSFIQLYSTVPLPVCSSIRFAWAATRGEFLDPRSPTPVYFAPTTGFPSGEEVLVTLTVTDAQGNKYSDQIKLHVNDTP